MGNSNFVWKCHFQMSHEKSHSDPALLTGKYLSPQNFHIKPSLLSVGLDSGKAGRGKPGGTGSTSPSQQVRTTASPSQITASSSSLIPGQDADFSKALTAKTEYDFKSSCTFFPIHAAHASLSSQNLQHSIIHLRVGAGRILSHTHFSVY